MSPLRPLNAFLLILVLLLPLRAPAQSGFASPATCGEFYNGSLHDWDLDYFEDGTRAVFLLLRLEQAQAVTINLQGYGYEPYLVVAPWDTEVDERRGESFTARGDASDLAQVSAVLAPMDYLIFVNNYFPESYPIDYTLTINCSPLEELQCGIPAQGTFDPDSFSAVNAGAIFDAQLPALGEYTFTVASSWTNGYVDLYTTGFSAVTPLTVPLIPGEGGLLYGTAVLDAGPYRAIVGTFDSGVPEAVTVELHCPGPDGRVAVHCGGGAVNGEAFSFQSDTQQQVTLRAAGLPSKGQLEVYAGAPLAVPPVYAPLATAPVSGGEAVLTQVLPPGEFTIAARGAAGAFALEADCAQAPAVPVSTLALRQFGLGRNDQIDWIEEKGLVIATGGMRPVLWDMETQRPLRFLAGHQAEVTDVSFHPETEDIYSIDAAGGVIHWDLVSGTPLRSVQTPARNECILEFSPDGQYFAALGFTEGFAVYRTETLELVAEPDLFAPEGFESAAWSPDGSVLAVGGGIGDFWTFDTSSWQPLHIENLPYPGGISALRFHPNGRQVFVGGSETELLGGQEAVRLVDITGEFTEVTAIYLGSEFLIWDVDITSDGQTLVATNINRELFLWDVDSADLLQTIPIAAAENARNVIFSEDGNSVLINPTGSGIQLLDLANQSNFRELAGHSNSFWGIGFSPDGTIMTSNNFLQSGFRFYDFATGELLTSTEYGFSFIEEHAWSPDGTRIVGKDLAGNSFLINVDDPTLFNPTGIQDGTSLDWYPDNSTLVYSTRLGDIARLDVDIDEVVDFVEIFSIGMETANLSPDASMIAGGSEDGQIAIVDGNTLEFLRVFRGPPGIVYHLEWSPDNTRIAAVTNQGDLVVYDAFAGTRLFTFKNVESKPLFEVLWSADGSLLSAGGGQKAYLFDGNTYEMLREFATNEETRSLAFAPDGKSLVLGTSEGAASVWEFDAPRALLLAAGDPDPNTNALTNQARDLNGFAYSTLLARGYEPEDIRLLSAFDAPIDGSGDGQDDTDAPLTRESFRESLLHWATEGSLRGRRLFLYMMDHGIRMDGETYFILNACETISATELDAWLDELQDPERNGGLNMEVTVVVDCCFSGQFATACAPSAGQQRAVFASTTAEDLAIFLPAPDLTSFSHAFFGAAYLGASLEGAFQAGETFFANFPIGGQAPQAVSAFPADYAYIGRSWLYAGLGRGFDFFGELGSGSIAPEGAVAPGTELTLTVQASTLLEPQAVLADVLPPAPEILSSEPVTEGLPTFEFTNEGNGVWTATFTVEEEGVYTFGAYASLLDGRRSRPVVLQATVAEDDPEEARPLAAVIVAGQDDPVGQTGPVDDQALELAARAYTTVRARGYEAGNVAVLGPAALATRGTPLPQAATLENLQAALLAAAAQPGTKLFLNLVGPADPATQRLLLGGGETLGPNELRSMLTPLLDDPKLDVILVVDAPFAGQFADLAGKQVLVVAGTTETGEGFFLNGPTYQSFSRRFLEATRQGRDLFASYEAGVAFADVFGLPRPVLTDQARARDFFLGRRGVFASDAGELAAVCAVSPDQLIDDPQQANLYVQLLGGIAPDRVLAQAVPFPPSELEAGAPTVDLILDPGAALRWEPDPADLAALLPGAGTWQISFEAIYPPAQGSTLPRTALNRVSRVTVRGAASDPDIYEFAPFFDDSPDTSQNLLGLLEPQNHTIHETADQDWALVYQTAVALDGSPVQRPYSLEFTNLRIPEGQRLRVRLYEDGPNQPATAEIELLPGDGTRSLNWSGEGEASIWFSVTAEGGDPFQASAYTVAFRDNSGANNGLVSQIGTDDLLLTWGATGNGLKRLQLGTPLGFRISRREATEPAYTVVAEMVPIPTCPNNNCGLFPGNCCQTFRDTGVRPDPVLPKTYFYQIELVTSSGVVPYIPLMYGILLPGQSAVDDAPEEWMIY